MKKRDYQKVMQILQEWEHALSVASFEKKSEFGLNFAMCPACKSKEYGPLCESCSHNEKVVNDLKGLVQIQL